MGAEFANASVEAGSRDPLVFGAPSFPVLPLRTAHPTEHHRQAFAVGEVDHGVVGDLGLPANQVQTEILYVTDRRQVSLGIILEEQIRRIDAAPNKIARDINPEVEVPAGADRREIVVTIPARSDLANTEIDRLRVGSFLVDLEVQPQMIEIRRTPKVGPPEVRIGDRKLGKIGRRQRNFPSGVAVEGNFFLKVDGRLALASDLTVQRSLDRLVGSIVQVAVDGESGGARGG